MYFQPYGDEQQLNLNWIINEIINLHKQLDPNYETPSFTQIYPYSNLNRLNLDWVLSELKALKELAPEPTPALDIQAVAEALVALPFNSNTSYQIYDFISRNGEIWRATEPIAAGGEWDETKWFKTKLGTDLAVLERWINAINNSLTSLQNTVADLSSADISDDSDAGGATVKASLNNLKGSLNTQNPFGGTLPNGTDLNDVNDFGTYWVAGNLSYTNVPDGKPYGLLEVKKSAADGNTKFQFFVYESNTSTDKTLSVYYRLMPGSSWYPWQRIDGDEVLTTLSAFAIPSAGSSVSYNLEGMTDYHFPLYWRFSASPENDPPTDLSWTTYNGYFTITNNGVASSETIRPIFVKMNPRSSSLRS